MDEIIEDTDKSKDINSATEWVDKKIQPKIWNSGLEDSDYWTKNHSYNRNLIHLAKHFNFNPLEVTVDQYYYSMEMLNKK